MARKVSSRKQLFLLKMIQNSRRRRSAMQKLIVLLRRRRQLFIRLTFVALLLTFTRNNTTIIRYRTCRRLQRNTGWIEQVLNTFSEARFKSTFRITRETFWYILSKIQIRLDRQTVTEDPISPACRLAICLYRLARGDYFYTISELFGFGRSTVSVIVNEVTQAIIEVLWDEHVSKHFPRGKQQFEEKMLDMEELWQFPCSWAAIDGCHIPLKCPDGGLSACKEYHNFKNFYSVVLMGLVDAKYRFIWGSSGFPGNSHDSIIFQSTQLWRDLTERETIPPIAKDLNGTIVPPLILGDSAFPFQSWLKKPFTNAVLTPQQHYFNYRLSRARMVTEGAYGQLKGRWRVLMRKCESPPETARMTTLACIILHNICIERGDTISKKLDLSIDPATNGRRNRDVIRRQLDMTNCQRVRDNSCQAARIRSALSQMFWEEKQDLGVL